MDELAVDVALLDGSGQLGAWEQRWREHERSVGTEGSPYLSYDWLASWVDVYQPGRLAVVCVGDGSSTTALGLVDVDTSGRWRFAGHPVTPHRALLAVGPADAAWTSLAHWLREHKGRWKTLDAEGVSPAASALPGARLAPDPVPVSALAGSFEEFLASLPGATRRRHNQRLRRFEEAGGSIVEPADSGAAVRDLIRLHTERARAKGEVRAQMNEQLARLFDELFVRTSGRVTITRAEVAGEPVGMAIHLDHEETTYYYNGGMSETGARLSAGIVLELDAIRTAIARGSRRFDLGPGTYRYKTELGGVPDERFELWASSPTIGGVAAAALDRARGGLKAVAGARRLRRAPAR